MGNIRKRAKADYVTKDIYKGYVKICDNPVDEKTYNKFWDIIGDKIFHKVIYEAATMPLPGMFNVCVREIKPPKIATNGQLTIYNKVDWKATKEYHKQNPDKMHVAIYHKNTHSQGRTFKYIINPSNFVKAFAVYGITLVRNHIRELPKAVKTGKVDFYLKK